MKSVDCEGASKNSTTILKSIGTGKIISSRATAAGEMCCFWVTGYRLQSAINEKSPEDRPRGFFVLVHILNNTQPFRNKSYHR